jgi:hypothetical protein
VVDRVSSAPRAQDHVDLGLGLGMTVAGREVGGMRTLIVVDTTGHVPKGGAAPRAVLRTDGALGDPQLAHRAEV